MNMKWLKWIAIITMTIDHIGFLLIPNDLLIYLVARAIGRVAFPLFAMMIAEGFRKTHSLKKYFLGLLLLAGVSELAFVVIYLFGGPNLILTTNAFLPLMLGLLALILIYQKKWYFKLLVIPILLLAYFGDISYGIYGLVMILIFGIIRPRYLQFLAILLLSFVIIQWPFWTSLGLAFNAGRIYFHWLQWFSLLAFIPIFLYNGKRGTFNKWFFYVYYPAHFLILYLISYLIQ